uniref:MACPF domain-containing protein n=1 Tax=Strigamia maritima TaxID=126957 RepID=T1IZM4_STRMM
MWLLCMTLLWHTLIANCNYQTTCPKNMQKLNALPGHGWDSIRNKNMKNVLEFTYNKCRTTEDGKYLIPDNIIAINESGQHITSEFIGHYMNYSSVTSESFVTNVRLNNVFGFASVQGSCDIDLLEAKKRQVNEKSKTTRVQAHNNMYAVQSIPDAKIDPKLKSIFDRVIDATESNNFEKAQSLCQYIVRDYGTHYIDHTHAGAVLLEEDYISSDFVSRNGKRHILAAAGAIFSKKFKIGKISVKVEDQFLKQYEASRTSFNIRSIGGAPITPNTTVENWIKNIGNNIVVIDRSGKPLPFLLSPEQFPNVSLTTLNTVKNQLDQVIKDYYS